MIALTCAALLVACGDDDDGEPIPTATVSPATESTTQPASPTSTPEDPNFSADRALEQARVLAVDIGSRPGGTDAEREAAEYIRDELGSYGYDSELQPFPVQAYETVRSDLSVTFSGGELTILNLPLTGSDSGDLTAEIVDAGRGFKEDFPGNTSGRVALIERGDITFSEKAGNAQAAGAIGAIIFNNEGGPLAAVVGRGATIPLLGISQDDGLMLRDIVSQETASASIGVEIRTVMTESQNVIARPPGGDCRLIAGGHYDSVPAGPGANDNASGTAVVIEMARVLAADGVYDDVCWVLFGSEELGLLGSDAFVRDEPLEGVIAMLNFDMLAVGDVWPLGGTTEIVDAAGEVAEGLGIPYQLSHDQSGGSDHASFITLGVPALIVNCFCDPNYHTAADRFEFLSRERIEQAGALGLGLIERLFAE
ncbi:MAG: M28 family peptidase [Dehalococcoidia bacterium]